VDGCENCQVTEADNQQVWVTTTQTRMNGKQYGWINCMFCDRLLKGEPPPDWDAEMPPSIYDDATSPP